MLDIARQTFQEFSNDKVPRLAAALAYYSLFSLAPLLVIAIGIAGFAFGEEAARGEIVGQIRGVVGEQGGQAIQTMVENAGKKESQGIWATIAGFAALLFGASGVFAQLKDTMNTIWGAKPAKFSGVKGYIVDRLFTFAMVLSVGFLLLVSLVLSAALAAVGSLLPGGETVGHVINALVSVSVITVLFALIFKYIPDAQVEWRDVWTGAAFTSFLFVVGKFAIGFYLGKSTTASTYGAAASLIIVVLWLYYSGLILFLGAEFTEVYARKHAGLKTRAQRKSESRSKDDTDAPDRGPRPVEPAFTPAPSPVHAAAQRRRKGLGAPVAAGVGGVIVGALVALLGTGFAAVKLTGKILR